MTVRHARSKAPRTGTVLIDREGRRGATAAALFKPLLRTMERALVAGDRSVTLSGAKLNVVILALQKAIWVEEEVLPRDFHAFSALNLRHLSPAQRLRTLANRMLQRADRPTGIAPPAYPTARIVAEYRALTGQGKGDTSSYASRRLCGLTTKPDAFEPIRLPLSRDDAVKAIQHIHGFPSGRAAGRFIRTAIRELPVRRRPLPPETGR